MLFVVLLAQWLYALTPAARTCSVLFMCWAMALAASGF